MKNTRISLAFLMVVIGLIAIDIVWLRSAFALRGPMTVVARSEFFTVNVLVILIADMKMRDSAGSPFRVGFLIFGSLAVLALAGSAWLFPDFTVTWAESLVHSCRWMVPRSWRRDPFTQDLSKFSMFRLLISLIPYAFVSLPQLLIAWIGGRFLGSRAAARDVEYRRDSISAT